MGGVSLISHKKLTEIIQKLKSEYHVPHILNQIKHYAHTPHPCKELIKQRVVKTRARLERLPPCTRVHCVMVLLLLLLLSVVALAQPRLLLPKSRGRSRRFSRRIFPHRLNFFSQFFRKRFFGGVSDLLQDIGTSRNIGTSRSIGTSN